MRTVFQLWMRSGTQDDHLWGLFASATGRWTHHRIVALQWNAATLALTRRLLHVLWAHEGDEELAVTWSDKNEPDVFECDGEQAAFLAWAAPRMPLTFTLASRAPTRHAVYLWHRILRLLGNPAAFSSPDAQVAAIVRGLHSHIPPSPPHLGLTRLYAPPPPFLCSRVSLPCPTPSLVWVAPEQTTSPPTRSRSDERPPPPPPLLRCGGPLKLALAPDSRGTTLFPRPRTPTLCCASVGAGCSTLRC